MASLNPYVKANRFSPFDGETELSPGIKAVPTRGHTPGHSTYVVESKGQKLVVWGDLIHVASVQFDPTPRYAALLTTGVSSPSAAAAREFLAGVRKEGVVEVCQRDGACRRPRPSGGSSRAPGTAMFSG
jgi:glyoxylase-like metal-dependent hydrolase (beta-lactamase superfamily II)